LLTGSITDFGFGAANETMQFAFNNIGGAAAGLYETGLGGIIFKLGSSDYSGAFASDWSSTQGQSDTKMQVSAVPEPSTYLLFGLGMLMVAGFARRSVIKTA